MLFAGLGIQMLTSTESREANNRQLWTEWLSAPPTLYAVGITGPLSRHHIALDGCEARPTSHFDETSTGTMGSRRCSSIGSLRNLPCALRYATILQKGQLLNLEIEPPMPDARVRVRVRQTRDLFVVSKESPDDFEVRFDAGKPITFSAPYSALYTITFAFPKRPAGTRLCGTIEG